ncbi:FprA family A-type flavoprotein [Fontivita pretiosa]|uniref:FprA family A-type flavoprotein n=1 Tax=Fontivita pretiosa TaxID=2989684 RepID=UPI003D162F7C
MGKSIEAVADGIYRIGEFWPQYGITVNQFLIVDERPALIHTGTHPMYEGIRKAVAQIIDPAKLAYVIVPHFEADECGGMGRFVREAPQATLVCSEVGAGINLSGWDYSGPVQGARDGTAIELGRHRLRFLETPHVHHWDSMMVFEETTASLFPADLFIQPGDQPHLVREDLGREMCALYREVGIFAAEKPVLQCVDRLERLKPKRVHPMHGGSLDDQTLSRFIRALRTNPFAYEGKVFGRNLPT